MVARLGLVGVGHVALPQAGWCEDAADAQESEVKAAAQKQTARFVSKMEGNTDIQY